MSLTDTDNKRAVNLFEEAFARLKQGKPINLPLGTPVSLTNVAKEAGRAPSALRSERYPELLHRIKAHMASDKEKVKAGKDNLARNRTTRQRLIDCKQQRERLLSICHSQQTLIDELREEVNRLSEDKVVNFRER